MLGNGIRERGAEDINITDCFVRIKCSRACRGRRYGRVKCDSGGTGRYEIKYIVLSLLQHFCPNETQMSSLSILKMLHNLSHPAGTAGRVINSEKEMKSGQHHSVVDLCGYCV